MAQFARFLILNGNKFRSCINQRNGMEYTSLESNLTVNEIWFYAIVEDAEIAELQLCTPFAINGEPIKAFDKINFLEMIR